MDPPRVHAFKGRVTFFVALIIQIIDVSSQQSYPYDGRSHARDGVFVPPGTNEHRTYIYKDRRYGWQPGYLDSIDRGPTRGPEDRFRQGVS